ncbi:hypothetical protein D3C85_1531440 [compost metagenome]
MKAAAKYGARLAAISPAPSHGAPNTSANNGPPHNASTPNGTTDSAASTSTARLSRPDSARPDAAASARSRNTTCATACPTSAAGSFSTRSTSAYWPTMAAPDSADSSASIKESWNATTKACGVFTSGNSR